MSSKLLSDFKGDPIKRKARTPDPVASRRGRNNRKRGNALQAWAADLLGWMNVGPAQGPADAVGLTGDSLFVGQVKSGTRFPGWMAEELEKLPRTGGRTPVLIVVETPGPGRKRRAIVVMDISDFRSLHGAKNDA